MPPHRAVLTGAILSSTGAMRLATVVEPFEDKILEPDGHAPCADPSKPPILRWRASPVPVHLSEPRSQNENLTGMKFCGLSLVRRPDMGTDTVLGGVAVQIEGQARCLAGADGFLTCRTRPSAGPTFEAGSGGLTWGQARNLDDWTLDPMDLSKRRSAVQAGCGTRIWGQTRCPIYRSGKFNVKRSTLNF